MNTEIWKSLGPHTSAEISNYGRVRDGGAILKQVLDSAGYARVPSVYDEHGRFTIHALVMGVFVGPPMVKQVIRHLNGIPCANWLWNLQYGEHWENYGDTAKHKELLGINRPHVYKSTEEYPVQRGKRLLTRKRIVYTLRWPNGSVYEGPYNSLEESVRIPELFD
jgi:hypothetical protein